MDFQPMSPEEMQRAMQFLLSQQAQFAADIAKVAEARAADDVRWNERFQQLSGKTDQIAVGLIGLTGIVGQLAAAQQRTDKRMDDVGEYIKDRGIPSQRGHRDVRTASARRSRPAAFLTVSLPAIPEAPRGAA